MIEKSTVMRNIFTLYYSERPSSRLDALATGFQRYGADRYQHRHKHHR